MIRVLVADDHAVVREGLKRILLESGDIHVVAEAANGPEVLQKLSEYACDLVILDMSMPGTSGLDVLKQVKCLHPRLPILILSIHPEEQYAVRVLRAGASGYLTKETAPEELIHAVRKTASGRKYVSSALAERLADDLHIQSGQPLHKTLSDREFQVFSLIASGKTVHSIAEEMHLSVKTISTYRKRILEKMSMKNNAELIHYAITEKLVDL
jgi:two-component system invasion response regulator UvrY